MKSNFTPTFNEEMFFWGKNIPYVIGIDEVGRGCFAGPVVVAGVIFHPFTSITGFDWIEKINDSKLLTEKTRELLTPLIQKHTFAHHIAEISVETINEIGIGKATFLGMKEVVENLQSHIPKDLAILVDAFTIPNVTLPQKGIIKGDQKCISIAAASIIAKVYRDNLMKELAKRYEGYDFEIHKGYGTKKHRNAIKERGLCDLHRTSFSLQKYI